MVLKWDKIKSPLPRFMILHPRKDIYNLLLLNYLNEKKMRKNQAIFCKR